MGGLTVSVGHVTNIDWATIALLPENMVQVGSRVGVPSNSIRMEDITHYTVPNVDVELKQVLNRIDHYLNISYIIIIIYIYNDYKEKTIKYIIINNKKLVYT